MSAVDDDVGVVEDDDSDEDEDDDDDDGDDAEDDDDDGSGTSDNIGFEEDNNDDDSGDDEQEIDDDGDDDDTDDDEDDIGDVNDVDGGGDDDGGGPDNGFADDVLDAAVDDGSNVGGDDDDSGDSDDGVVDDDADMNVGADDGGRAWFELLVLQLAALCAKLQRGNCGVGSVIHAAAALLFDEDNATADDGDTTDAGDNELVDVDADTFSGSIDESSENLVFVPSLHLAHEKRQLGFLCSHLSHFHRLLTEGSFIIFKVGDSRLFGVR